MHRCFQSLMCAATPLQFFDLLERSHRISISCKLKAGNVLAKDYSIAAVSCIAAKALWYKQPQSWRSDVF